MGDDSFAWVKTLRVDEERGGKVEAIVGNYRAFDHKSADRPRRLELESAVETDVVLMRHHHVITASIPVDDASLSSQLPSGPIHTPLTAMVKIYLIPKIHPSIRARSLSAAVRGGSRNSTRLPSKSALRIQAEAT